MRLNLGVRAHDFKKLDDLESIARVASDKRFTAIQLALAKSLPSLNSQLGALSPGMARHITKTLNKYNVDIAVLGCYINPVHPDENKKRYALERFKEHIRFAHDFNCSIVGTETGSLNADLSFTPENHGENAFTQIARSVSELVEEAEKFGVIVGVEAVTKHTINSAQKMKRLLDTIASNNLQVILDPVNLIDINNYKYQDKIIMEALELLEDRIVIIHAKDFIIDHNEIKVVPVGKGILNYKLLLKEIKQRKPFINVLLENTKEDFMDESIQFLNTIYQSI